LTLVITSGGGYYRRKDSQIALIIIGTLLKDVYKLMPDQSLTGGAGRAIFACCERYMSPYGESPGINSVGKCCSLRVGMDTDLAKAHAEGLLHLQANGDVHRFTFRPEERAPMIGLRGDHGPEVDRG
jgi:hypothetical protein